MVSKKHLYRLVQVVALTILLVTNGFILDYILNIENGFGKDKNLVTLKECQTNKEAAFFGFDPSVYQLSLLKVKPGQSLSVILNAHNIPPSRAEAIIGNLSQVINLNSIRAGNTVGFAGLNPCLHPDYLIYEVDDSKFITCELRGDLCASVVEKPTSYIREQAMGIIETTLWDALQDQNLSLDLIDQMEDALSSAVDFHHVQKGNTFKLIFDRRHLDGQPTPSGKLIAAYFDTGDRESYAISYLVQNKKGFYDLKGSPMASKFLQAPVRFSRISSGFNMKRFHPVLKYHRPHLGTDYAAPYGTPIMSVGAGVVESASYTAGNGNYVKIRHDKTYQTQYLHMSKFAKGIRRGAPVSQGQVIGYVGSTGLASGPHVCFRFWKDGRQVNHRALRFPSPDPLPSNLIQDYYKHRDAIVKVFDSMQFNTALNDRS